MNYKAFFVESPGIELLSKILIYKGFAKISILG